MVDPVDEEFVPEGLYDRLYYKRPDFFTDITSRSLKNSSFDLTNSQNELFDKVIEYRHGLCQRIDVDKVELFKSNLLETLDTLPSIIFSFKRNVPWKTALIFIHR